MQLPDVQQWLLYMLAALAVWWVVSRIRKRRAATGSAKTANFCDAEEERMEYERNL